MGEYLAQRIIDGKFKYENVIEKYPNLKDEINNYLIGKDRRDLIGI